MEQIKKGVSSYYEIDMCQKLSGFERFAAYFVLPSIPNLVQDKIEKYKDNPLLFGIFDDNGLVDLEVAKERASLAMQKCGSIDLAGFRLTQSDVERVYDSIRRA